MKQLYSYLQEIWVIEFPITIYSKRCKSWRYLKMKKYLILGRYALKRMNTGEFFRQTSAKSSITTYNRRCADRFSKSTTKVIQVVDLNEISRTSSMHENNVLNNLFC